MTKLLAMRGAGYSLGVLFLINFLNFFDRAIPAVVLEPLRKEFQVNDTWLGLLVTAFTLVYAAAGIPLGRLSDNYPRTRVLGAGVFLWSLMTAASGVAWSFVSFFLIRIGVGIGEASCAPAGNSMIGDLFPARQRGRALGIFMLGLPLGGFAAFAGVGYLAQHYGWRTPFMLAALPGFVAMTLVWFLKEPQRGAQEHYALDAAAKVDRPFRRILSLPTVWWIILSGVGVNFAAYAINTFLPALMIRYHGLNVAQAGGVASIVLGLTGLVGLIGGGWAADFLHQRYPRGRLMLGAGALLIAAPLLWFGFNQPVGHVAMLTVLLGGGWLLVFVYYTTVYAALQDVVEPRLRATAMAVYLFFNYVLGAAFGSTVTGVLSDHGAHRAMSEAGATVMTDAFRAAGLQSSLSTVVPLAIGLTGVALWIAAHSFVRDIAKTQRAASAGANAFAAAAATRA
jgi:predicted MFS family arabinose efflux permease